MMSPPGICVCFLASNISWQWLVELCPYLSYFVLLSVWGQYWMNKILLQFWLRDDDPARGYIISTIFFISGIVTLLQSLIGCRLPIIQGGTFTFVTPTLAILALDNKWTRPCPSSEEEWADIIANDTVKEELWQVCTRQ